MEKPLPRRWQWLLLELLGVFLGVTLAFSLDKWNEARKLHEVETQILREIDAGLAMDLQDLEANIEGHRMGLAAVQVFRKYLTGQAVNLDSMPFHYFVLLRDFISLQNSAAYESLKSQGLGLIRNDSLRLKIVALYDFDMEVLQKLEEDYSEMQFNENFYHAFNDALADYMVWNREGQLRRIRAPEGLPASTTNRLLAHLWKIEANRRFTLQYYQLVKGKALELRQDLARALNGR
ncbi:MAG: hypothetical protein D6765_05070 [Bacteroidetes bacterium]|nr:MAG: hypothetical protein D6765_05070 [Bacteroidota bacterium]